MVETDAVQEAVSLLRTRRSELMLDIENLDAQVRRIDAALAQLVVDHVVTLTDTVNVTEGLYTTVDKPSVRAAVQEVLLRDSRGFFPEEMRGQLIATFGRDESKKYVSNIRTAMWSLRKSGVAYLTDDNRTRAIKWREPTDANGPVAAGPLELPQPEAEAG